MKKKRLKYLYMPEQSGLLNRENSMKQYAVTLSYTIYVIADNEKEAIENAQWEYETARPEVTKLEPKVEEVPF